MSSLKFIATKQRLIEAEQPFVVANSIDYLSTVFEFSTEWNNCINTAVFRNASGTAFSVQLDENNSCTVPWEVIECPYFTVSVYGVCGTKRITTNRVVVKVEECGYAKGETPEEPTPTVYETIINKLDAMGSAALCDTGTSAGNIPVINNDGKLEKSIIPEISAEETDPIFTASPAYSIKSTDIDNWNAKSEFSGDYNDLINKPEIPSDLTDLTGTLPIEQGGTGGVTAKAAQYNILKVMGNDNNPPSDASEFVFALPTINASEVNGAVFKKSAAGVWGWIASKTDNSLNTTSKTIIGAINELQSEIGDVETALATIIGGATE